MSETTNDVDERIAKVECTHCNKMVHAYRTKHGRVMAATTASAVLGAVGATIGTGIGVASGGTGTAATYYLGAGLAAIGGGYGYIAGSATDQTHCPNCEGVIELGI